MKYNRFLTHNVSEIKEINSTLIELEHCATGAQVMHIANDDEENLFNLSFRTWPETSNGVAHILEHTVLCGSEHFPMRDPFFAMSRRSLNTFMNALTGGDFTCYPAASQIEKDFYNLLLVYLDAVFKPKLTKLSFLQEGHRLEFLKPDDPNSPLTFKGIVYNEMKGAMATGEARLSEAVMHALFPDLTYGINSGGDPKEIPLLTYEALRAFHAQFYHPSRCLFFFYGNLPLEKHLDFLEEHAFKGIKKMSPLPPLPCQPRFQHKVEKTFSYPIAEEEDPKDKTFIAMAWLTCSILEQEELLALCVLDLVLMGTDAAPLKRALLKSNLCKQVDSAMDIEMSEIPFSLVFKGCAAENAEPLEQLTRATLLQIIQQELPVHLIEGAIHQLEMARKEITGNSSPYGLHLFFRSGLLKQHGGNPEDGLRVHTLFEKLRQKVQEPGYLTGLLEKYFLHNPHSVRIVMQPDKELNSKEVEEEQERLKRICVQLKDRDVQAILVQSQALTECQEEDEEEKCALLPTVSLNDVATVGKEFLLKHEAVGSCDLFYHPCFTNELLYADLIFDLPDIAFSDLPYLRLFAILLPQMGCGKRNYQQHLEYLLQHTGGVGVSLDLGLQTENPMHMRPSLSIRGKALYRKLDKFFPILRELAVSVDFKDVARLQELLMQHYHGLENSIQRSSLRYAVNLAARGLSIPSTIINAWYGLDYYWAVKQILNSFEKDPSTLIEKLEQLQTQCLCSGRSQLVLSCDEITVQQLKEEHFYGIGDIPAKAYSPWKGEYPIQQTHSQGRITASPVAFTAMLFPSVSYLHPHAAALSVASEIMENKILHLRIREQGGAYGAGAVNGVLSGQFYFYSYRDPHLSSTIDAFHEAVSLLANGEFDLSAVEEAKLGLFQELDSPTPPGARAITAYERLRGNRTPEIRQQFRHRLYMLTKQDVQEAAIQHLIPGIEKEILVSFAGKELLEKESSLLKKTLPLYSI